MSTLTARVGAMDAARIRKRLSLGAEKARAGGDRRGHQQIMADQFVDVLLGRGARDGDGSAGGTTMEIRVIITDRSLLAPAHADAAVIEGVGSVPYEHVREEMLQAITAANGPEVKLALRNLYIDPDDGQLVAVQSRSRAFPPALSRFLRWSHLTCRAPYCDAPIRQIDHITPHSRGGATSRDNGNSLCAGDNQKEEVGVTARVITDEQGRRASVEWRSRYGQKARRAAQLRPGRYRAPPPGPTLRSRRPRHDGADAVDSLDHRRVARAGPRQDRDHGHPGTGSGPPRTIPGRQASPRRQRLARIPPLPAHRPHRPLLHHRPHSTPAPLTRHSARHGTAGREASCSGGHELRGGRGQREAGTERRQPTRSDSSSQRSSSPSISASTARRSSVIVCSPW